MKKAVSPPAPAAEVYLGIEGGGTRTVALAVNGNGKVLHTLQAGPANLQLLNDAQLLRHLRFFASRIQSPSALAIGLAGARTQTDRNRIQRAAAKAWPGIPCFATNDLETALMAAPRPNARRPTRTAEPSVRVLILSGTGSCCFGRTDEGRTAKVGGWGHILGDKGSGYEIGLRGLKAVLYYFDRDGKWPPLGQKLLRALQLNHPNELIGWAQTAAKMDIAALAPEVLAAWKRRDPIASDIVAAAVNSLAKDAAACAGRLVKTGTRVQFVLAGSVLLKHPGFARQVCRRLSKLWPRSVATPLTRESVWGAVELARRHAKQRGNSERQRSGPDQTVIAAAAPDDLKLLARSPTEQRNPNSMRLHELPPSKAIALMLREDMKIPPAILEQSGNIERALRLIVRSFRQGGRLFYAGAGTSGRLGVLDASECPPTFRTPPEMVQGIIAGGQRALWEAVEGAEDDTAAGAQAMEFRGISHRDVVVGIAASGRTPFVWGAFGAAKRCRAKTVLLTFNPNLKVSSDSRPNVIIAPKVGPEVLTGSTRLKAGTATKLILNILTTLAMVRMGKVMSNLMVDVKASNSKLRDRAARILQELTGADYATAWQALEKSNWQIKAACARVKQGAR